MTTEWRKDDWARCIDARAVPLTYGNIYSVLQDAQCGRILVQDDTGKSLRVGAWLFQKAERPPTSVAANVRPRPAATPAMRLSAESAERKEIPLTTGLLDYFPDALAAVARLSKKGNDKHNPGEPLHHARDKSTDHADCIGRHLIDRGTVDPESGELHDTMLAWRALANLQVTLERTQGLPLPRGAQ